MMKLNKDFINKLPQLFLLIAILSGNIVSPLYAFADDVLPEKKVVQIEEIEETQTALESVSADGEMSTAGVTEMDFWDPLSLWRPSKPILISPIEGVVINNNRPLMQWEDSELGILRLIFGKIKKYNYEYHYECTGTTPESCEKTYKTTTKISEYPAGETADGRGFWRVQAVDDWGILEIESEWSDYAEFTVDTIAPTATVEYSTLTPTNDKVDAIVTFNEPIREIPTKESGYDGGTIPTFVKCIAEMTECTLSHWGNRDYVIAFYDLAGNKGTAEISIKNIDKTKPTATVIYSPSTLTNQKVDAIVTFSEPIREIPTKESGYDGGTIPNFVKCNTEMTECTLSHWAVNRDYVIAFYDLAGNKGTAEISIKNIDIQKPTVEISDVAPYNPESFKVEASDTNGLKRIDYSLYTKNNTELLGIWGEWITGITFEITQTGYTLESVTKQLKDLEHGEYTLRATVGDEAGNVVNAVSVNFIVDRIAPTIPTGLYFKAVDNDNTIVACGGYSNTKHITEHWNEITEDDSFSHYEYSSFDAPNGNKGLVEKEMNTNSFDSSWWTIPREGTYGFQVRSVDKAENKSTWANGDVGINNSCTINIDWVTPTVEITSHLNDALIEGNVEFKGTVTDDNLSKYSFKILGIHSKSDNTETGFTNTNIYTWDTTEFANGKYQITLEASDKAGNTSEQSISVTVNNPAESTQETVETATEEEIIEEEVLGTSNQTNTTTSKPKTTKRTLATNTNVIEEENEEEEEIMGEEIIEEIIETTSVLGEDERTCTTKGKVSGNIFEDKNDNGILDESEKTFENVSLKIYIMENGEKKVIQTLTTDEKGYFETTLCAGKYNIEIEKETIPSGYEVKGESLSEIEIIESEEETVDKTYVPIIVENNKTFIQKYWYWILLPLVIIVGSSLRRKKKE